MLTENLSKAKLRCSKQSLNDVYLFYFNILLHTMDMKIASKTNCRPSNVQLATKWWYWITTVTCI